MIENKADLKLYLKEDKAALHIDRKRPKPFRDDIWRFEIILRKDEYWHNCGKGIIGKLMQNWYALRHHRKGVRLGLQVPLNVCDYGLHINHYGLLIISPYAKIGKYFNVHQGCNIGTNTKGNDAPVIGDNVFFAPGVKAFGDIKIALMRELTKKFEEHLIGTPTEILERFKSRPPKGEFVLIFNPKDKSGL